MSSFNFSSALLLSAFLTLVSSVICIRSYYQNKSKLIYIFKPLTTLIIIATAFALNYANHKYELDYESNYGVWIIVGLLFSLAGDIFLMLPSDKFIQGLVSFLIAHLIYIGAFVSKSTQTHWGVLLAFILIGIACSWLILPHTGKLKIPVVVYMIVLLGMAWRAAEVYFLDTDSKMLTLLAGSVIFVASDLTLAINRFRTPFRSAEALILSTYFLAQWLIAASIIY